jgi:hypothetical protein
MLGDDDDDDDDDGDVLLVKMLSASMSKQTYDMGGFPTGTSDVTQTVYTLPWLMRQGEWQMQSLQDRRSSRVLPINVSRAQSNCKRACP